MPPWPKCPFARVNNVMILVFVNARAERKPAEADDTPSRLALVIVHLNKPVVRDLADFWRLATP